MSLMAGAFLYGFADLVKSMHNGDLTNLYREKHSASDQSNVKMLPTSVRDVNNLQQPEPIHASGEQADEQEERKISLDKFSRSPLEQEEEIVAESNYRLINSTDIVKQLESIQVNLIKVPVIPALPALRLEANAQIRSVKD
jgi:hypothetical protein